jgi:DNA-binding response OmpR family regulator
MAAVSLYMGAAAEDVPEKTGALAAQSIDVLIVEDDRDMRELIEQLMLFEGYAVGSASDGGEALECMRRRRVRLVLLDLMLPAVNGFAFRRAQLSDERLADIPVVIISGTGNLHVAAADLGVRDYLVKPLDFDKLLATVRKYIG